MMSAIFTFALVSAAGVMAQDAAFPPAGAALSVFDVIERQRDLLGSRVVIRGRLSTCQHLTCTVHGKDRNGRDRFLSIGRNAAFDAEASRHAGQTVEIEARLSDVCLPNVDPTLVPLCTDRPATLADPIFLRAL